MPESLLWARLAAVGGRDRLRAEDRVWLVRLAALHDLGKNEPPLSDAKAASSGCPGRATAATFGCFWNH